MYDYKTILIAMIQFAVLGTAGEVVSKLLLRKTLKTLEILYMALVWAVLGAIIKYAFVGFDGFVNSLVSHHLLPSGTFWEAFFKSVFINTLFGPWLVILHRFLDNLPYNPGKIKKEGLKGALLTLLWFWIPAHTITFLLPEGFRITMAAIWSFVLGLILGIFLNLKTSKTISE